MAWLWAFCIFLLGIIISIIGAHLYNSKFNNNNKDFDKIDDDHEAMHKNQLATYDKIDSESQDIKQAIEKQTQEYERLREEISHKKEYGQEFEEEKRKILELSENSDEAFEAWEKAQERLGSNEFAELLVAETKALEEAGEYYKALETAEKAYKISPTNFDIVNWYGCAFKWIGDYESAKRKLEDALRLAEDQKQVATAKGNLACLLHESGNYKEAEALYRESLDIKRDVYETNHQSIAIEYGNLAGVLQDIGRQEETKGNYTEALSKYQESVELFRKSLAMCKIIYNSESSHVATALSNLAGALRYLKEYEESEELYRAGLDIARKVYRPDHPKMAIHIGNLAGALQFLARKYLENDPIKAKKMFEEAEKLFHTALEIIKINYEESHPYMAVSISNIASLYSDMGRYNDAKKHIEEAIAISNVAYGENHPNSIRMQDGLKRLNSVLNA